MLVYVLLLLLNILVKLEHQQARNTSSAVLVLCSGNLLVLFITLTACPCFLLCSILRQHKLITGWISDLSIDYFSDYTCQKSNVPSRTINSLSTFPSFSSTASHFSHRKMYWPPVFRSRTITLFTYQLGLAPKLLCHIWTFHIRPMLSGKLEVNKCKTLIQY